LAGSSAISSDDTMDARRLALPLSLLLFLPLFAAAQTKQEPKKLPPLKFNPPAERPSLIEKMNKLDPNAQSREEKLRSPREMMKTFFFAVALYDSFPGMIEDALQCLDLDREQLYGGEGTQLAIELEALLRDLEIPLISVPDSVDPRERRVVIHETPNVRIAVQQDETGAWQFDRDTLRRVSTMRRNLEKPKTILDKNLFREGFSSPRETMRQFVIDSLNGDFYSAARALDLSSFSNDQRTQKGPVLAQQLAYVIQHRSYVFFAELPTQPPGTMYTWHADRVGRIALEKVRQADGKDAWLFSRKTVTKLDRMYQAAKEQPLDARYYRMGIIVPPLPPTGTSVMKQARHENVPPHLGSPRAVLKGFFRAMDGAESNDSRIVEALEFMDLRSIPATDRVALGPKLAQKLEAVLRKVRLDLSAVPDDWNAAPYGIGEAATHIEITRQYDGCWRFSDATVARVQAAFDQIAAKERSDKDRTYRLESARDAVVTFLNAVSASDFEQAAECLDLHWLPTAARDDIGASLAYKLKYSLDRLGRLYVQEIPDDPNGARFIAYRGEFGRIVLARKTDEPGKGTWLFTPDTVKQIDPIFRAVMRHSVEESLQGEKGVLREASFMKAPGVWLRLNLPDFLQVRAGWLEIYQWIGLAATAVACGVAAWLVMKLLHRAVGAMLSWGGSNLTMAFVASKFLPFTWLAAVGLFFQGCVMLDLPLGLLETVLPARKFILSILIGWLAGRMVDFVTAVSTNSELMQKHRSLSDLVVPVTMRIVKSVVWLLVATYMVFQIGEGQLVGQFLTGLGVLGLGASLAAQDALKSFFGTLLLIGERTFKIGDRIMVDGKEGVVEAVGFRVTEMRTPEGSLLTIPNSMLASASIDNQGARAFRRIKTSFLVAADTPLTLLTQMRDQLFAWLSTDALIRKEWLDVHVHQITEKGVEIAVNLTLSSPVKADENRLRQDFHCEVLRAAEALGVSMAGAPRKATQAPRLAA
jgi:MscS family membrane protein